MVGLINTSIMITLGIITFILFWVAIIWDFKRSPTYSKGEFLEDWEKPYYIKENLFEHNGRMWEHLDNHPKYKLRVFNDNMTDYEYKEKID